MRTIRVQSENFDDATDVAALAENRVQIGAVVTFTGVVRHEDTLTALVVEHYPGMTEREISRHVEEAERRWPLLGVTVVHRIGRLVPGDNIVRVAVAAAHRHVAFEAAEFLIDYLKTRAPFWKQEERGATTSWVEAKESDDVAAARWNPP